MPQRGESSQALLGEGAAAGAASRGPSNARRYGPSASSSMPMSTNSSLSPTNSSTGEKARFGDSAAGWSEGLDGLHAGTEADDYLHNPDPKRDRKQEHGGTIFTTRGLVNIGCLFILVLGVLTLFAGYPIISFYTQNSLKSNGAYNLGGINSTGQVPLITNFPSLIDTDTPQDALTRTGFDGNQWDLVFSDEFNKDGRTFFDGDDPFWTAVDIHYWPTGDFEWYDPAGATTRDGSLVLTMSQQEIHDLNFRSGMLQSWNKMCFQYSVYFEVRVSLPGSPRVGGFWPGAWMMGNLGRPGYGATTEGTWPYTYDSCDIGTLANQTNVAGTGPDAALTSGTDDGPISFLPGQRVSACTCAGEDHPGPVNTKGRGAPEIDAIEAQIDLTVQRGQVSQSFQIAPFDDGYWPVSNSSTNWVSYDADDVVTNSYRGGVYQQALSHLAYVDDSAFVDGGGDFAVYGFEFFANPDNRDEGYITWVADGKRSWHLTQAAAGENPTMQIGQRIIPEEPMAMILNFGMSNNFQAVDFANLPFPSEYLIDYVRVYQRPGIGAMGCDPADHPTADYISRHANAYSNPNLTTWDAAGYTFPKNRLKDGCT